MELLVVKAFMPAGGPFIVLLPACGPFIFLPQVDTAFATAGGPFIFCSTSQLTFRCILSQLPFFVTAAVLDRGGQRASCSFFFSRVRPVNLFVRPLATPRCEAAPWDLVMHTTKGDVARATSVVSCVGAAAGASISTLLLLLLLELRPPVLRSPRPAHFFYF